MKKSEINSKLEKLIGVINDEKLIFYSLTSLAIGLDAAVGYGAYLHIEHPESVRAYNEWLGVTGDSLCLIFPAVYANVFSAVIGNAIYSKRKGE